MAAPAPNHDKSKTAIIVGASRGLGLGLAREFASRGWQVTATFRGSFEPCMIVPAVSNERQRFRPEWLHGRIVRQPLE